MRNLLRFAIGVGLFTMSLNAGTIAFSVSTVGVNGGGETIFRYTYDLTGLSPLALRQEVDIRFDPTLYGPLFNGVAGPGFDLQLFQPNNPPGATGDYSALALINNPARTGIFSVDFTFHGSGTPGAQPFFINQYDASFNLVPPPVDQGFTTPVGTGVIPEPATFVLSFAALLFTGIAGSMRRRRSLRQDL